MWKALPFVLLLVPAFAQAEEHCRFNAARDLKLDLTGVRSVVIEVGRHDFHVKAGNPKVTGRACASSQEALDQLQLAQRREGNSLIIGTGNESRDSSDGGWFGKQRYAYLDINVSLPKDLPVTVAVGSGDADVAGLAVVESRVGSGDLDVRDADRLQSSIGSGDLKAGNVGRIEIDSIGSGDFEANAVREDVRIGSIGSGDAELRGVGGSVEVRSIGSGNLTVAGVGGDLRVRSVGSGDVDHRDVKGRVDIPSDN